MDGIASALGDAARWRIVELLAERPRSVGELAELTGARQPQTTKHLQTLARAGLVTVHPLGQRRVYALEPAPLTAFARRLRELASMDSGERDVLERYRAAIEAETALAERDRWADGRTYSFERVLAAPPSVVWRHWVEPDLLESWWAPSSMTVTECALEPRVGGRAVLEYADAEGRRYHSDGAVHLVVEPSRLAFDLSIPDAGFTGHYDLSLVAAPDGTRLRLDLHITDSTVEAVPYIAGIKTGWDAVLDNLTTVIERESS